MIFVDEEAKQLASDLLRIGIEAFAKADEYPGTPISLACYNLSAQEIGEAIGALANAFDEDLTEHVTHIELSGCTGENALQELLCTYIEQIAIACVEKGLTTWN